MKLRNPDPADAATAEISPVSMTRRIFARRRVETMVFVSLDADGAGSLTNCRENGPASPAIRRLAIDQTLQIIFKLAGIDGWMRATTKVMWLSDSGRAAGLKFVDMPDETGRLVEQWLARREQAVRSNAASGSQSAPADDGTKGSPPHFNVDSYQVALPVEAIEIIPAPFVSNMEPVKAVVPSSTRKGAPRIETDSAKDAAAPETQGSLKLPDPARVSSSPMETLKNDRKVVRSFTLTVGALIAMFAMAGLIVWQIQDGSILRLVSAQANESNVPSVAAAIAQPQIDASVSSTGASVGEFAIAPVTKQPALSAMTTQNASKWGKPAKQEIPRRPDMTASAFPASVPVTPAIHPLASRTAPVSQIPRAALPSTKILRPAELRPVTSSHPAVNPLPPVTAPANSISERPAEPVVPAATAEMASIPAAVTPLNSENQTGSIEINSDPYPSIRMPAGQKSRGARPATLTIGHLVSRVEPVYPTDALRQRISGTVKVHVVLGIDGRIETALVIDGPVQLREAALHAVQQWRYEPTLLGSSPVEAEEYIMLVFRITTSHPAN